MIKVYPAICEILEYRNKKGSYLKEVSA